MDVYAVWPSHELLRRTIATRNMLSSAHICLVILAVAAACDLASSQIINDYSSFASTNVTGDVSVCVSSGQRRVLCHARAVALRCVALQGAMP
jgi:hypothetical protein